MIAPSRVGWIASCMLAWLGIASCGSEVTVPTGSGAGGAGTSTASGGTATTSTSSSASTSTSSPSGTSSTTTTGPCDVGNCSTCLGSDCVATTCAVEIADCDAEPECRELEQCHEDCQGESACNQQCKQMYPEGVVPLFTMLDCIKCAACYEDCGGPNICPYGW